MATPGKASGQARAAYVRHRPEDTLLYQIVEENYPTFHDLLEQQGRPLPVYVEREFDEFLKCGRLEHGFFRVRLASHFPCVTSLPTSQRSWVRYCRLSTG
jgi:hypothetical protein